MVGMAENPFPKGSYLWHEHERKKKIAADRTRNRESIRETMEEIWSGDYQRRKEIEIREEPQDNTDE